jgi:uncharacterized delta-60 repeat protein
MARPAALIVLLLLACGCVRAGFERGAEDGPAGDIGSHDAPSGDAARQDQGGSCAAGALDTTFGGKGFVVLPVNKTTSDQAKEVAVDATGRIVVAGQTWTAATGNDLFVTRSLASGALDTGFGAQGIVQTQIGAGVNNDALFGMTIDGAGRIVAGGQSYRAGNRHDFAFARYTSTGALDANFGTKGVVVLNSGANDDRATNLVVDGKGRVVFSGWTEVSSIAHRFLAGRITAGGVVDQSFAGSGVSLAAFAGRSASAWAVGVDSAGRVVAGGYVWSSAKQNNDVAVARYTTDGFADTTFAANGELEVDASQSEDKAWDLVVDTKDRILLVGQTKTASRESLLVLRLTTDGKLDTGFGDKGIFLTDASLKAGGYAVLIDGAGRVVAAGHAQGSKDQDVLVVRLRDDGTPDPSFHKTGRVVVDLGREEYVREAALDAKGRLLVTGWHDLNEKADSFLLRLCM